MAISRIQRKVYTIRDESGISHGFFCLFPICALQVVSSRIVSTLNSSCAHGQSASEPAIPSDQWHRGIELSECWIEISYNYSLYCVSHYILCNSIASTSCPTTSRSPFSSPAQHINIRMWVRCLLLSYNQTQTHYADDDGENAYGTISILELLLGPLNKKHDRISIISWTLSSIPIQNLSSSYLFNQL